MKEKIYLSGPLFSEAEIVWAGRAKALLEERLGEKVHVFWPHEVSANSKQEIFRANLQALEECKIIIALLDGAQVDDGTAWEVGYCYARGGKVLGLRTDFRRAGEFQESKVNAMIECSCLAIVNSLEQLVLELEWILA